MDSQIQRFGAKELHITSLAVITFKGKHKPKS